MSRKTVTIDTEAYTLLVADKGPDESLSMVIKRRLRPAKTARALLDALPHIHVDDAALDRIEDVIRARRESPAASPIIARGAW